MDPVTTEQREASPNLASLLNSEKSVSREYHLEHLLFALIRVVEELASKTSDEFIYETDAYADMRILYKALAKNRRLDGSKYRGR